MTISPKATLCEQQPVTIDDSVFYKLETEQNSKIFEEINIESELNEEGRRQIHDVLENHINIFSKNETDIGRCDRMKPRIDLADETRAIDEYRHL